jgi:MiaB/RimO family radical SAM methylthiotransferase
MSTFVFVNHSCYRRQEEVELIRRFLVINGFGEGSDLASADLAILFTCAFSQSRVADMLREIERIRPAIRPECELIVGSCLPKTDRAGLERVFRGRTITPTDMSALNELPGITAKIEDVQLLRGREAACATSAGRSALGLLPPSEGGATRSGRELGMGLFIASGCRRRCSYCAIRFATGPLRSKPLEEVTRALCAGLDAGHRRFEVHADCIGDYGLDIGRDLGELLDWMLQADRDFSVGIHDLHPQSFLRLRDELRLLCEAGRMHYLYVPVQSGSERILRLMNRPCDADELRSGLQEFRRHAGLFLQTSIIVGFPSESDEDFEDTLALLRTVGFSNVYVHSYSDMPRTESSRMSGKVDKATMRRRIDRLAEAGIPHDAEQTRHEWESIPG